MKKILLIVLPLLLIVGCSKPIEDSTLINKDGLMYSPDSDKPYTGEVYTNYDTGEKLYQGTYENGLLVSYSYLNKDGSVKEPINFKTTLIERDGVFYTKDTNKPYSGPIFSLHENRQKKWEVTLKDGKKDGLSIKYNRNGLKTSEKEYVNGKRVCLFNNDDLQVMINSLIDGLETWGMETFMDTGILSYPDNPFDIFVELPECYVKSDEPKKNGNWWFSNDTIYYGFEDKWFYDSDSGFID